MNTARVLVATALVLPACAGVSYVYRPTGEVTATEAGYPAARHLVPPEAPRGDVTVTSFGVRVLQVGPRQSERFVHARLVVANHNSARPWSLLPGRQTLVLPDGTAVAPRYANSSLPGTPAVTVRPGDKAIVDLYYRPPAAYDPGRWLPAFDLRWFVRTDEREVADRTVFERFEALPTRNYYGYDPWYPHANAWLGWGSPWWYDPFWGPSPRAWWGPTPRGHYYTRPVPPPMPRRYAAPPAPARPVRPASPSGR